MRLSRSILLAVACPLWIWTASPLLAENAGPPEAPSYSREILPLLSEHCFVCHGASEAEAGLRLDGAKAAQQLLDSGLRAIVPGNPDQSELLQRVTSDDDSIRMPPDGDRLTGPQVDLLRRWISDGAQYEEHWAWKPVVRPAVPDVGRADWSANPIDRFVLARLEQHSILPSPRADRATLIQRLYCDLVGLPPEPPEVDAFVHDESPNAYESLVDRLLESQHFGERWGRHWLDMARYADSDGYEKDNPRPNAWKYRDWVIDAINRDLPFDQFTIEQLAGDLLPDATSSQKLATAFHRQTLTNTEGGADQEQFRIEANFDRTETTSAVWMALTMTCARCHDHKYDEISQREYYQLFAFFNDANDGEMEVPINEARFERYERNKKIHNAKVAEAQANVDHAIEQLKPEIETWIAKMDALVAADASPLEFTTAKIVHVEAESGSQISHQADGSILLSGESPETDKVTVTFEYPEQPLTGIRIEVIPDDTLPAKGPGRAPNGNFVLTHLRIGIGHKVDSEEFKELRFPSAHASHTQAKFLAADVFNDHRMHGWAVGGQTGQPNQLTVFRPSPLDRADARFVQVVMDQQYGGKHTIGRFRISTMAGFDPLLALPESVAVVVRKEATERTEEDHRILAEHVASQDTVAAKLVAELAALKSKTPNKPVMKVRIVQPADRTTHVLHRGDFLQPADPVTASALAVVHRHHPLTTRHTDQEPDRLDLAHWLVDPRHPLTARVVVNQVWTHLFGSGIVATIDDFGVRGDPPTHPGLLDWLAWQFPREMKWSRKQLIKTIVMSETWRQSSSGRQELEQIDPTNRLLARQNRIRVEAEIIRDMYLSVGGLLDRTVGGASVFPPLPPGVAELSYANNFKWKTSQGDSANRRGMYTFFKRTAPHPTLISFDCPDSNTTRISREISNTPLQALVTLNNEVYAQSARALAGRVLAFPGDDRVRLAHALKLCVTRSPSEMEIDRFHQLLEESRAYYQDHVDDAKQLTSSHAAANVTPEENAAWVATVRIILNLDEFIVRD